MYSAVSDFVNDFNIAVEKGEESSSKSIIKGVEDLVNLAQEYKDELNPIGIPIDKENKLVIDKASFMKTDINKIKELFNGQN